MNTSPDSEEILFEAALKCASPEERRAFLDQACAGKPDLRRGVEALLAAHEQAGGFMAAPAPEAAAGPAKAPVKTIKLDLPPVEGPGILIGRYKILEMIGEGGFGVVYVAEQREPVKRRVALKVIKPGMDTRQVVARFEAERQALALMDHPNIAKVLDAGATDNGRPYFVMELVRGIPITKYCDQEKLSTRDRLDLFIKVCHAIQHAHQKGIIHRDIKPSNILVTLHDGVPVPKVIDFGIAKATQQELTEKTVYTQLQQFIGTPAYMSPEQAEMSGLDIDTRSDIYSLGVLLYELLTGRTPFDGHELINSGIDAMRRTIREQEPPKPSTRVATLVDNELSTTAARRSSEAPKLVKLLRGDLDWIVMKCLEKDRTRRFETASSLATDINRYLTNEPVEARAPSSVYRFQKLVRRNRIAFFAGAAVVAALALGFGFSTVMFIQERAARKRADEAERIQATLAKEAEAGRQLEIEKRRGAEIGEKIGLAALYLTQGKYVESEKEIAPVPLSILTNHIATSAIVNSAGEYHARLGEWREAITNYAKVVAIVPADFPGYHRLAPLLVQVGDLDEYHRLCGVMLRQFAGTADPAIAAGVVRDCLILPPPAAELDAIGKFADSAAFNGVTNELLGEIQLARGLVEYRRGNFAGTAQFAKPVVEQRKPWNRGAAASMILAMAQFKLNQTNEARETFADGLATANRKMDKLGQSEGLDNDWHTWIVAHALISEAQALVAEKK